MEAIPSRFAPLPPSRFLSPLPPSETPPPNRYTYLVISSIIPALMKSVNSGGCRPKVVRIRKNGGSPSGSHPGPELAKAAALAAASGLRRNAGVMLLCFNLQSSKHQQLDERRSKQIGRETGRERMCQ